MKTITHPFHFTWLLFTLLLLLAPTPTWSLPTPPSTEELRSQVNALPHGEERLQLLRKLVRSTQMSKEGIHDARQLLYEAQEAENDSLIAYSVAFVINHLFAQSKRDIDSIRYWTAYALPIAQRCHYWSMYFQMKYTLIQTYIYAHSYEYAKAEARQMVAEAKAQHAVSGELIAYSCLAMAHYSTREWKETEEALHHAHDLFSQDPPMANKIMVLKLILTYLDAVNHYVEMRPYLIELQRELNQMVAQLPSMANALNDYFLLKECYSISYHVHCNELEQADTHIANFKRYQQKLNYQPYYIIYTQALTSYYMARKQYNEALALNDSALYRIKQFRNKGNDYIYCLEQRGDIYYNIGNYSMARMLYEKAGAKRDSLSKVISDMQLDEYRGMYKVDMLKIEKELLGRRILRWVLLIILLLGAIAIPSFIYFYHTKRKLQKNRERARKAMQEAKQANESKREFLGAMSHAIRVPLNSVVGFSQIVASEEHLSEEERTEYAGIIQRNTALLMFQVNSVLDLSRLEAGMTKWQLADCDLIELLQQCIGKACYLHPTLSLHYTLPSDTFMVHTDPMRMQYLIDSLLSGIEIGLFCTGGVTLTVDIEGDTLHATIVGSPLARAEEQNQRRNLRHRINQLTLAYFGGTYQVDLTTQTVRFTYPRSANPS